MEYRYKVEYLGGKMRRIHKNHIPHELKNATLFYLSKNLRTTGICKIPLDIPLKGEYYFNCLKKADDETVVLTDLEAVFKFHENNDIIA